MALLGRGFGHKPALILVALLALSFSAWLLYGVRTSLRGTVLADGAPLAGAVVRIQGSADYTITDQHGAFTLTVPLLDNFAHVTASAPGFYIAAAAGAPPTSITLTLLPHPTEDNPDYAFISPILDRENEAACARCHADRSGTVRAVDDPAPLPVDEWLLDAHAQSAVNPRFLSLYNGTALDGTRGDLTAYQFDSALGIDIPTAPTSGQGDVGFRLDFPDSAGSCAACHVPILALEHGHNADPNTAAGVAREGVTCDFCHKISGVSLGANGLPAPDLPGVFSLTFLRPSHDEQVFMGPFDDTPGDDIYLPLQSESQFCAACHTGSFWGVSIYNSFGEWLDSPYSDPISGQTCQDCHMPRRGTTTFVDLPPDVTQFVPVRDPQTIFSHLMPGAADEALLATAAAITLDGTRSSEQVRVTVEVTNTGTGHHLPTDNPLRQVILLVEAHDADGNSLTLLDGARIPAWGGIGDPAQGYYAGLPGVLYAKILADAYTGEMPTAAYWRQTSLVSDNRIAAFATDTSTYQFRVPANAGSVTLTARLILRRAFIDLMAEKGWDTPDLLIAQETITVP